MNELDNMAESIVRLEAENSELRAEVAMLTEERRILYTGTVAAKDTFVRQYDDLVWAMEWLDTLIDCLDHHHMIGEFKECLAKRRVESPQVEMAATEVKL